MNVYEEILSQVKLPDMFMMKRTFPGEEIADIPQAIGAQIDALSCKEKVRGRVIALAVGSRGIANLPVIVSSVVKKLRLLGAKDVYIVPAMGSHGGAIAENQKKMLAIDSCIGCGQCKAKCPYGLDTPELLKLNLEDYKNILSGKVKV